jgi:phosphate transport system permease protein
MKTNERIIENIIRISAAASVAAVALITIFIFITGYAGDCKDRTYTILSPEQTGAPPQERMAFYRLIAGSLAVTLGALVIGIPTGSRMCYISGRGVRKTFCRNF